MGKKKKITCMPESHLKDPFLHYLTFPQAIIPYIMHQSFMDLLFSFSSFHNNKVLPGGNSTHFTIIICKEFVFVQLLSRVRLFGIPWHDRLLFSSPSPRICSNSHPLSCWCYLTISSSPAPFSFCLQFFPALNFSSELALHIRWPMYWSFSFSVSPCNEYSGWFPLGLTGLISLQSKGLSKVFFISFFI